MTEAAATMAAEESGRRRRAAAERAIIVLAVFATLGVCWLARDVLVPFSISVVVATVLRPLVRRLERLRLPSPAAAASVVIATILVLVVVGIALEQPLRSLGSDLPRNITIVRTRLDSLAARVRRLTASRAPVEASPPATSPPAADSASSAGSSFTPPPGTLSRAFSLTTNLLAEIVEEVLLVFFLLAAGDEWLRRLSRIAHTPERAERWRSTAGEMHDVVARYLVVTLLINLGQAVIIGLVVWAFGVPSPFLWAALTFVAEFIPYLGGMAMIGLLALVGFSGNQGLLHALLPPGSYLVVTTLQNNLVSPIAYGRGLRLNPTAILVAVMFWWMVWGVAGAFLAVPILASLRVLGTRLPSLTPLAVLLEE